MVWLTRNDKFRKEGGINEKVKGESYLMLSVRVINNFTLGWPPCCKNRKDKKIGYWDNLSGRLLRII